MSQVSFKRITPTESRIFSDGDHVGDVNRQEDILNPGRHYYVVHLSETPEAPAASTTAPASAPSRRISFPHIPSGRRPRRQ